MGQDLRKPSLYERDFYSWSLQQAELMRARRFREMDTDNLVEEIESLGRAQASSLQSSFRLIIMHLLKMLHQPDSFTDSWRNTIARERVNAEQTIEENPGLQPRCEELFLKAYAQARKLAATEADLPLASFPVLPELTLEQVRDEDFWPIRPAR